MDIDQAVQWNALGIIQGPEESDGDFEKRARYLEEFKKKIAESLGVTEQEKLESDAILQEAFPKTREIYGMEPKFVPVFFSNDKLPFWHGGVSWIVQLEKDSPTAAFIQLRKKYTQNKKVLFYKREEILVHELSHVGRMRFDCPVFEEILAWSSSSNAFRRFFGPLFASLKETSIFAFVLITLFLIDIMSLFFGDIALFESLQLLKAIPLAYLGYMVVRLFFRQRTFSKCLAKLQKLASSDASARHAIYRLSDKEIFFFSKKSEKEIKEYAQKNSNLFSRWKTLCKAYGF